MLSRRNFLCRIPLVAGRAARRRRRSRPSRTTGTWTPPRHVGAVGTVDPAANGFDPQAILRDFDEGVVRGGVREWELVADEKEIEVAPGVKYAAWAYNGRVPGPDPARARGRAAADPVRERRGPSAHDPLPRHPHRADGRGAGSGGGQHRAGPGHGLRVRRRAVRAPPLPLPLDPARRPHREGALRRVRDRPEAGHGRRPTSW